MIVVVEGIDRVGKTTLVNKLVDAGFISLKDEFLLDKSLVDNFNDYSIGKCESFVKLAKELHQQGKNVVIDRLHLTEYVYGIVERGGCNEKAVWMIDMMLACQGAVLCYITPSNWELTKELSGADQTQHAKYFDLAYGLSSMSHLKFTYEEIDTYADYLTRNPMLYDFYFASPFFNPEQVEREERMIKHLRNLGFKVFSPKESCHLDAKASQQSREDVFESNCRAIQKSRAVFAVTDGKDMGTIWEAGYAYGIKKPIVYFAETLGDNQFNLMLAQSGRDVYTSQDEVTAGSLVDSLNGKRRKYRGDIE